MYKLKDLFRIGGKNHYALFESDGFLTFKGDSTFYQEAHAIERVAAGSNSATLSLVTIGTAGIAQAWSFAADADNSMHSKLVLPPSYKSGTKIKMYVDFVPAATDTNAAHKVAWVLSYVYSVPGAVTTLTDPTAVTLTPFAPGVGLPVTSKLIGELPETNFVPGTILHLTLLRDVSEDDHTAAMWMLNLKARFECDTLGLRTATTK